MVQMLLSRVELHKHLLHSKIERINLRNCVTSEIFYLSFHLTSVEMPIILWKAQILERTIFN